ncbi:hypothetical protein T11_2840 [Trichinella zimbabwensis]|uniref:Uncharacterized protein n=1 Tax=Trichinella zimbabwensis TaxID=268475 RepID=A0A0V1GTE4_9BILA|nr:hypothetical protein T11_2840 [Trichinella zimbabwensis]
MENWVILPEANSMLCHQSGTWSAIIPLSTHHEISIFVHALNYLAIPGIKNTNVQAADTVVLMPMTIYDKVWSLVCRHPARSSFNEGLSQQSQSGIFFVPYHHDMFKLVASRVARRLSAVAPTKLQVSTPDLDQVSIPDMDQPQATPPGIA